MVTPKSEKLEQAADIVDLIGRDYLKDLEFLRNFNYYAISETSLKRLKSMFMKYSPFDKIVDRRYVDEKVTKDSAHYIVGLLNNIIRQRQEEFANNVIGRVMEEMTDRVPSKPKKERTKTDEDVFG